MSAQSDRLAEIQRAAREHPSTWKIERGYMIATVTGLNREQAQRVREAFQRMGWSATAKNRYTEVRAERKI